MRPFTTSPLPPACLRSRLARSLPVSLPRPKLPEPLPRIRGLLRSPQQPQGFLWFLRSLLLELRPLRLVPQSRQRFHPARQQLRCRFRRSGSPPDKSCPPSFRQCPESPSIVPASFPR